MNELFHGLYENCAPGHTQAAQRLEEMKDAGMDRVLNYWAFDGTDQEVLDYADAARDLGLKLIWPHGATSDQIELVKDHPATWGFYIGEEAMDRPDQLATIRAYAADVADAAPDANRLYVEWGMTYFLERRIRQLVAHCSHIAADFYPVGTADSWQVGDTSDRSRIVQRIARNQDVKPWMVLQAFSWASEPSLAPPGDHRWPTVANMREMKNRAAAQGIHSMLWFDYYFIRPPGSSDYTRLNNLAAAIA